MKKIFLALFFIFIAATSICFAAEDNCALRDYDGIEVPKGTFIPVISAQEISTAYFDEGQKVKFIATNDLYLYETNVIPQNTEFYGYIEKINEPIVGTNASMIIKINKLKFIDGFEIPMKAYLYVNGETLIGGELTPPATYDKKASYRQGFATMTGYAPGATRQMGQHTIISSGAELMIMLAGPLYITHTILN